MTPVTERYSRDAMGTDTDPRPPLPEWILDVYKILSSHATAVENDRTTQSITRDRAIDILLTNEELALESEDVNYALTRLLNRGYFYEVGDELRVTTTE